MLKTDRQQLTQDIISVRSLYDKYAGMLFGYILEVVKDRKLAEECMVQLFHDISQQFNATDWELGNSWCRLQGLAHRKLVVLADTFTDYGGDQGKAMQFTQNNYLRQLSEMQRQIFCAIYYGRKRIAEVSEELNITEDLTRKTLKEAFAILREGGKN